MYIHNNDTLLVLRLGLHSGYRYACSSALGPGYGFFLPIFTPQTVSLHIYKDTGKKGRKEKWALMRPYDI